MSSVIDTDDHRRDCLERVLKINPHNETAQWGLEKLRPKQVAEPPQTESEPEPSPTTATDALKQIRRIEQKATNKCPYCGELLEADAATCCVCGCELRTDRPLQEPILTQSQLPQAHSPPDASAASEEKRPKKGAKVHRPGQSRLKGVGFVILGVLGIGIGIGLVPVTAVIVLLVLGDDADVPDLCILLPGAVVIGLSFLYLIKRGQRHLRKVGLDSLDQRKGEIILYLRSFAEDAKFFVSGMTVLGFMFGLMLDRDFYRKGWTGLRGIATYEELLTFAFRKIGQVAAIGNPSDELPTLGPFLEYVGGRDWKTVVADSVKKSALVLLHIGESDGLMWEVKHVAEHVNPEQLILCCSIPKQAQRGCVLSLRPAHRLEKARVKLYYSFRDKTESFFPKPLPEEIGNSQFIYFDNDWTPIVPRLEAPPILPGLKAKQRDEKLRAINWLNSILIIPTSRELIRNRLPGCLIVVFIFIMIILLILILQAVGLL